jgi:hypothetical protein
MSGMSGMGNMSGMGGMNMNGMSAPDIAMGRMGFMNVMTSRAMPGFLMRPWTPPGGMYQGRFSVSGWTDMSFTGSSADQSNLPMGFNYKANQFLLQQNWLRIDQAVDENATSASFGWRSDWILPGSDYRFFLPMGIFTSQLTANNGMPNTYGFDPIQFYGEVYLPNIAQGTDIKFGRWGMLHGVEMNEASMNLLASHSYTYIADPFTHTGLLATTRFSKQLVTQAAITTGSDIFVGPGSSPTFVGSTTWFSRSGRTSLKLSTVLGSGKYNQSLPFDNRNLFDVVLRQQILQKTFYVVEGLYGYETNVTNIGTARWFGVVQYLTYNWTDKLAPTTRLEFFDDINGERTGFPGLYTALTSGIRYQPAKWFTFRPEIRYDNCNAAAFEGKHGLVTADMDVIVLW